MTARIVLGAALGLALSSSAFAQSYTAPAGIPSVTAPGGLEGRAAGYYGPDYGVRAGAPRSYSTGDELATGSIRGTRDVRPAYAR